MGHESRLTNALSTYHNWWKMRGLILKFATVFEICN